MNQVSYITAFDRVAEVFGHKFANSPEGMAMTEFLKRGLNSGAMVILRITEAVPEIDVKNKKS